MRKRDIYERDPELTCDTFTGHGRHFKRRCAEVIPAHKRTDAFKRDGDRERDWDRDRWPHDDGWLTGVKESHWLQHKDISIKGVFPENFTQKERCLFVHLFRGFRLRLLRPDASSAPSAPAAPSPDTSGREHLGVCIRPSVACTPVSVSPPNFCMALIAVLRASLDCGIKRQQLTGVRGR
ncbi:hypothetical protein CRUP_038340 [Coryphaenoides rupestris]|nr:hypothetical protein CRUP_038340 [Coryphaenoides rupestris]